MMLIDYSELNRVYLFINFKPLNSQTMMPYPFKVDTGADTTTMSKEHLYELGYDYEWVIKNIVIRDYAELANKTIVEVGIIQFPLINILGYECKNWAIMIVIEDGKDFRNLLGRDLLAGFNYTFDNDKKKFLIEKTKSFSYIGNRFKEQSINELKNIG